MPCTDICCWVSLSISSQKYWLFSNFFCCHAPNVKDTRSKLETQWEIYTSKKKLKKKEFANAQKMWINWIAFNEALNPFKQHPWALAKVRVRVRVAGCLAFQLWHVFVVYLWDCWRRVGKGRRGLPMRCRYNP